MRRERKGGGGGKKAIRGPTEKGVERVWIGSCKRRFHLRVVKASERVREIR